MLSLFSALSSLFALSMVGSLFSLLSFLSLLFRWLVLRWLGLPVWAWFFGGWAFCWVFCWSTKRGGLGLPAWGGQALPCPIPAGLEVTHPCRSRPGRERPTPRPNLAVPDPCRSGGHPSVPISAWMRVTHPTPRPSLAVPDPCRSGGHPSLPILAWPVPAVPMNSDLQRKGHRKWSSAWRWWSRVVWWLRKFWLLKLIWQLVIFGWLLFVWLVAEINLFVWLWEIDLVAVGYFW